MSKGAERLLWCLRVASRVAPLALIAIPGVLAAQEIQLQDKENQQSRPVAVRNAQEQARNAQEQARNAQERARNLRKINLKVTDSTLKHVAFEIAKQAGLRLVSYGTGQLTDLRVTVSLTDADVKTAFVVALKGTGLVAIISDSDMTVVLRRQESRPDSGTVRRTGRIDGRVVDSAARDGVRGATVQVVGTDISTVTDEKGGFVLLGISAGEHTVLVRRVGFKTQQLRVTVQEGRSTPLTAVLISSATALTEVVTTATGAQRRLDISNDVVKINADRLMQEAPIRSVTDLLVAAQVPGMIVTRSSGEPGAPVRIRLGGVGSISQNNDPVVIVDGVWVKSAFSTPDIRRQLGSGDVGQLLPSRLDGLDPSTIETIEIVRGPAAATLYGPDAANGVIVITTKRGVAGPARWDVQLSRDWRNPTGTRPPVYEAFGHTLFSTEPIKCNVQTASQRVCIQDSVRGVSQSHPLLTDEGAGFTNSASVTVNGGTRQIMYSLSAGLRDRIGNRRIPEIYRIRTRILALSQSSAFQHPSQMRDRNLSSRLTMSPRPGLDITLTLDGAQTNSNENKMSASGTSSDPFDSTSMMFNSSGSVSLEQNGSTTTRGLVSLTTRWSPYSWWMASSTFGIDRENTREKRKVDVMRCRAGMCAPSSIEDQSAGRQYSVYTIRAQSTFTPTLGWVDRFLSIQPGILFDLRRRVNYTYLGTITNQADVTTSSIDFHDGPTAALSGLAVNANIRLFDRISFDPAIRRDFGGSKALQNNSKTYPRFGTSWLVSEERFFPKTSLLTTLRVRGAFGYASVQPRLSQLYGRYTGKWSNINGVAVPSIEFTAIGNPNLQPERSVEIETGFDADLFDERVMVTVTYSNKQNRNTLIDRTIAPSAGVASTRQENIAKVVNHTTSIQVITRAIDRDNLRLRVTSTIGFLHNEIKSLGSGVSPYGTFDQRYVEGYPVGGLWQRPVLAVEYTTDYGYMGLPTIVRADSMSYMGTNLPRYTMGHNIELGFLRHFTLNALFDYKGAFMQNRTTPFNALRGYWDMNASPEEKLLPDIISSSKSDLQTVTELRLQSASLSVNVPPNLLRRFRAQSMVVSLQGANLGLWTRYRGRDPGLNSSPIGERLSDSGNTIGLPRNYSLQFRVRY